MLTIKIPKPLSKLEESFALQLMTSGIEDLPDREYKFMPDRKFRFDFAFPKKKIACEIEGGVWSHGRHTSPQGFINDAEKYNLAALHGWKVLRFTAKDIGSMQALKLTMEALNATS